jgi:hypothetical protein
VVQLKNEAADADDPSYKRRQKKKRQMGKSEQSTDIQYKTVSTQKSKSTVAS